MLFCLSEKLLPKHTFIALCSEYFISYTMFGHSSKTQWQPVLPAARIQLRLNNSSHLNLNCNLKGCIVVAMQISWLQADVMYQCRGTSMSNTKERQTFKVHTVVGAHFVWTFLSMQYESALHHRLYSPAVIDKALNDYPSIKHGHPLVMLS